MTRNGWREFKSSTDASAIRFDVMGNPPQFVRIRDRSRDDHRGRAYIVVDLVTLKVLPDQTTYTPKKGGTQKG